MRKLFAFSVLLCACAASRIAADARDRPQGNERPRAREIGIVVGSLAPGRWNAITDVRGVRVGHRTLVEGDSVRTGVTVVLPHGGNPFRVKVPAAVAVGNAFGKLVGFTQVEELGTLETPIALTNTLSVFAVADALVAWTLGLPGNEEARSVNPVAAECNDGYLNDIRGRHVTEAHLREAIASAREGPVEEGSVGAGTGTRCLGWKGGIGTSSRVLPGEAGGFTVGVLAQTNFGGELTVLGTPVGRLLRSESREEGGSCVFVVATDAPLDARQLKRLARRALGSLPRVGANLSHGSGDYAIAFSVAAVETDGTPKSPPPALLPDDRLDALFRAALEASEEAVLNSLLRATTVVGREGHRVEALPIDRLREVLGSPRER